jgi:hypothetical protein
VAPKLCSLRVRWLYPSDALPTCRTCLLHLCMGLTCRTHPAPYPQQCVLYVCCMCVVCVLHMCCLCVLHMCVACVLHVCCMCVVCVLYVCCMCVACVLRVCFGAGGGGGGGTRDGRPGGIAYVIGRNGDAPDEPHGGCSDDEVSDPEDDEVNFQCAACGDGVGSCSCWRS